MNFSIKKLQLYVYLGVKKPLSKGFLLFNEIAIFISRLSRPVRIFGFRTYKIKDYPCNPFNEDILKELDNSSSFIFAYLILWF